MAAPVLLVEDDEPIRVSIRELLEQEGFRVITAENGRVALDLLGAAVDRPALILLDMTMPVMNGGEFPFARKADFRWRTIPVVILSARSWLHEGVLGVDHVLNKPADLEKLIPLVKQYCG